MIRIPALVLCGLACTLTILPSASWAQTFHQRSDVQKFITLLSEKHQLDRAKLEAIFSKIEPQQEIIDAMNTPAEAKPWHKYRPIFVTDSRAADGVKFYQENRQALEKAQEKYGVDATVIAAIIGVESRYGQHKGKHRVIDALATLGFDYPRRGKFFRKELEQFLLLAEEESFDPLSIKGSYAGAMGKPQFIASSYRAYAVDFDNDGVRDLINNPADAIGSVASYLARHGWVRGQFVAIPAKSNSAHKPSKKPQKPKLTIAEWQQQGTQPKAPVDQSLKASLVSLKTTNGNEYWLGSKNFYAITRYNHSPLYAMAVFQLSEAIKQKL